MSAANIGASQSNLIKLTDQEFTTLVGFVKQRYGIDLSKKRILIEGRLTHLLRERGYTAFQQYFDVVFADKSGAEMTQMLNRLTTNLSYFMRENEHFEFLARQVLPYMEKTRNHDLRIWSAGCSSGQEAYTIAMTIDEYFGPRKAQWDTTILATDISMKVLENAKRAIYPADDLRDVPAAWKHKYFTALDGGKSYQVCEKIRRQVVFRPFNLMEPFRFKKPLDIIFCRNVMIYFDAPTKENLVRKFYDWSSNGGYLFIGHSESINREATKYTYIQPAIYRKGGK